MGIVLAVSGAVATPVAVAPAAKPDLAARLEEFGARLEGAGFSGALLVAKDGRVLLSKGYGLANRETGIRNTEATVFPVGSITKQFTAAGILVLQERGALSTSDPIGKYFRDVPGDKAGMTIHHLLTHSSGLVGGLGPDEEPIGREDYIKLALKSKLLWAPGSKYEYSNTGYSLLAAIIEQVSGRSWESFLRDNLFLPAGMNQTGCVLPEFAPKNVPHGYEGEQDRGVFLSEFGPEGPYWHLRGNGGINATIGDMYRWHQALLSDKVLSADSRRKAFTPYIREGDDADSFYGYGWALFKSPRGTDIVTHNGGNGIYTAELIRFVDEAIVVYGAANDARIAAWEITPRVADLMFGGEVEVPPAVVPLAQASPQGLLGRYVLPSGASFELRRHAAAFLAVPEGQDAVNLVAAVHAEAQARYASVLANTQSLLERIGAGHATPTEAESGWNVDEGFFEREHARRQRLEKDLGPLKAARALGTLPRPEGRGAVIGRLEFERGARYVRYLWGPGGRLWDVLELPGPTGVELFPDSSSGLFSYTSSTGRVRRLELVPASDGSVQAIAAKTPSGVIRAVKK